MDGHNIVAMAADRDKPPERCVDATTVVSRCLCGCLRFSGLHLYLFSLPQSLAGHWIASKNELPIVASFFQLGQALSVNQVQPSI